MIISTVPIGFVALTEYGFTKVGRACMCCGAAWHGQVLPAAQGAAVEGGSSALVFRMVTGLHFAGLYFAAALRSCTSQLHFTAALHGPNCSPLDSRPSRSWRWSS